MPTLNCSVTCKQISTTISAEKTTVGWEKLYIHVSTSSLGTLSHYIATNMETEGAESPWFYKVPLPPECTHFVDSTDSEAFSLLLWALKNSSLIAMDAEWKPVLNKNASAENPRVSILQIACRRRAEAGTYQSMCGKKEKSLSRRRRKNDGYKDLERKERTLDTGSISSQDEDENGPEIAGEKCFNLGSTETEACESVLKRLEHEGGTNFSCSINSKAGEYNRIRGKQRAHQRVGGTLTEKVASRDEKSVEEFIFILDLLVVPASAFGRVLKDALVDLTVLKLGFGFKQDLINLRSTFPGPESHGCFEKVDPYLDVGKLYRYLHENSSSYLYRGKRITVGGDGLASIVDAVLGLPLSKDMQCSNWEQRPLSPEQYDYAAADAYCLLAIFDKLQVKASDSWFAPAEEEDDEDLGVEDDVVEGQSKVGVAELLFPPVAVSAGGTNSYGRSASICQSKRGDAARMVEAALGLSSVSSTTELDSFDMLISLPEKSKTLGIEKLVSRFGEKLLVSGQENSSKRVGRKARSRRARVAKSKDLQDEDDVQWVGPPPWDRSVGGDEIPKFLCDAMVEGLARQLRCVGVDAASLNSRKCEPRELVDLAEKEGRILLTRDVKLLRRRLVPASLAYRVKRQGKWDQLAEIIEIFKLSISEEQLLTRCTKCNGDFIPEPLSGEEAVARAPWSQVIPACALQNVDHFWQCSVCKHVYWQLVNWCSIGGFWDMYSARKGCPVSGYQFTRAWKQFAAVCQSDSSVVHD